MFRNVAIIAHVDHGKTTLIDSILRQTGCLPPRRDNVERVMDSDAIERERGITILGKATSIRWKGAKINIADTPGHADFGGEVERMLRMVDGVLLLVDAAEGPLPQTRFVLGKALAGGLRSILVINKIDRHDARAEEVLNEVYDLYIELGADEHQLDFPVFYTNARAGTATTDLAVPGTELAPLLDAILSYIPSPGGDPKAPLAALITNLDYDNYVGRLGIGRVFEGTLRENSTVGIMTADGGMKIQKMGPLLVFEGLERAESPAAEAGEFFAVAGIEAIQIGDTLTTPETPQTLERVHVDEPTIAMFFCANTGPLSGRDGNYVTSRHVRDRLYREVLKNVSIRVEDTESREIFKVVARGELALAILIENMRREGFELLVSKPEVVTKSDGNGKVLEPMERLILDMPETYFGTISQRLAKRRGRVDVMKPLGSGRQRIEIDIPARGLIGFRSDYLNDTRGQGILNTLFNGWAPWAGPIIYRTNGALVADRGGKATAYAIFNLQPRGILFIDPQTEGYEGMVVGEHSRENDLDVNITREKKLTNMRAAGKDDNVIIAPPRRIGLEDGMQWIAEDELVEVTPKTIRLRKKALQANSRPRKEKAEKD